MATIDYNAILVNTNGQYYDWMSATYKDDTRTVNLRASGWEVDVAVDVNGDPIDWDGLSGS